MGVEPTIWHINEGHAAFQILERCREKIANDDMDFSSALELIAAGTVFTTHTPVAAGHDIFEQEHMNHYFAEYIKELKMSSLDIYARISLLAVESYTYTH